MNCLVTLNIKYDPGGKYIQWIVLNVLYASVVRKRM